AALAVEMVIALKPKELVLPGIAVDVVGAGGAVEPDLEQVDPRPVIGDLLEQADPFGIGLALDKAGLQRRGVIGLQEPGEGAVWYIERSIQADHHGLVFHEPGRLLLLVELPDLWMRLHDDAGMLVAVAGSPGPFGADDLAVFVMRRIFAEIPDVALLILGEI